MSVTVVCIYAVTTTVGTVVTRDTQVRMYHQLDGSVNVTLGQSKFCFRKLDQTEVNILRLFAD